MMAIAYGVLTKSVDVLGADLAEGQKDVKLVLQVKIPAMERSISLNTQKTDFILKQLEQGRIDSKEANQALVEAVKDLQKDIKDLLKSNGG